MIERIHSNGKIKVTHIGKNYYELKIGAEVMLLERSEARELIGIIDNMVTIHTPDLSNYPKYKEGEHPGDDETQDNYE